MPWQFDIRTALLLCAALTLLIGIMLQAVSHAQAVATRAMMRWWVLGAVAYATGFALTGFRDWIWIGWSAVLANTLIALGLACFAVALRRFNGLPERHLRLFGLVALVAAASVAYALVWPTEAWRHATTSVLFAAICFLCARTVYRRGHLPGASQHAVGVYFALGTLL
jgi:hypothetical protein